MAAAGRGGSLAVRLYVPRIDGLGDEIRLCLNLASKRRTNNEVRKHTFVQCDQYRPHGKAYGCSRWLIRSLVYYITCLHRSSKCEPSNGMCRSDDEEINLSGIVLELLFMRIKSR